MAGIRYSDPSADDSDVKINQTVYTNSDYTSSEAKTTVTNSTNASTQTISDSKSSNLSSSEKTGSPNGDDNTTQDGQNVDPKLVTKVSQDQVSKIQYVQNNNPSYFESIGENPDDLLSGYVSSDTGVTFQESEETTMGTIIDDNGLTYINQIQTTSVSDVTSTATITKDLTLSKNQVNSINPKEILKIDSDFAHPTNHVGTITSPFGFRILSNGGKWEFHGGTDIGAKNGTKVYAVYAGVIQHAYSPYVNQIETPVGSGKNKYGQVIYRSPSGYGNSIWLVFYSPTDGQQYLAIYAHLQDVLVKGGQNVVKGQVLGTIGDTGFSYGNHLHFELRNNNPNKKTILKTDYKNGYNGRKASGIQTGFYGVKRITDDTGDWIINNTTIFSDPKDVGIM